MLGDLNLSAGVEAPARGSRVLIESCDYADETAARAAWVPMASNAPASLIASEGGKALRFECHFAGLKLERASWDRKVKLDLSSCRGVQLQVLCRESSPVSYFSIYFQSGAGWYHASFYPESDTGWNTVTIDKTSFSLEGTPAGWGQISAIRISAWRGKEVNTEFCLRDIRQTDVLGEDAVIAIIRGDAGASRVPSEARSVEQFAEAIAKEMRAVKLGCAIVSDRDLSAARLRPAKLVILPHNPGMSESVVSEIKQYVNGGGKLLAFYTIPQQLRAVLHVEGGEYIKAPRPGYLSSIHFEKGAVPGVPAVVGQQSGNISALKPVAGLSRTVAEWFDDHGQPTGYPAVLASSNGLVMTHVLLPDDPQNKARMLLALVGHLVPALWEQAAQMSIARVGQLGGYHGWDEAASQIAQLGRGKTRIAQTIESARDLRQTSLRLLSEKRYAEAMQKAGAADRHILEAYCQVQQGAPGEFRAFWCHSAFGVDGIEWDEAIRRLAENGFTAILPNMLWGGVAFYESSVLPVESQVAKRGDQIAKCLAACRKYGVQVHIWKVNWNLGHAAPKQFLERMRTEKRLQANVQGKEEPWLCPSDPRNQQLEIDSMVEVARKYDVDGIHFDYIRYPDAEHCFCVGCRERFKRAAGVRFNTWPQEVLVVGSLHSQWLEWRRANITAVVKAVSQQARAVRPGIKISAAVFPNWDRDRDSIGQDWTLWCEKGYLDFVCPMDYTASNRSFKNMVEQQLKWAGRVPCYPGIGVSASTSRFGPDRVIDQIKITRQLNTSGFTIFNYGVSESRDLLPLLGLGITARN